MLGIWPPFLIVGIQKIKDALKTFGRLFKFRCNVLVLSKTDGNLILILIVKLWWLDLVFAQLNSFLILFNLESLCQQDLYYLEKILSVLLCLMQLKQQLELHFQDQKVLEFFFLDILWEQQ